MDNILEWHKINFFMQLSFLNFQGNNFVDDIF